MICLPKACYLVNLQAKFGKVEDAFAQNSNCCRVGGLKFTSRTGYHALGSLEMCELGQNSNFYYIVLDELTDIRIYLYVEVDCTRIHQYLKRFFFGTQIEGEEGGNIKFSVLFKWGTEFF